MFMNHISEKGILFIRRFEGFRARVYKCQAGYRTIGYGHVLRQNEQDQEVTLAQAEEVLLEDLAIVARGVMRNTKIALVQHQFDALISLVFNIGVGAYQRSTLRAKISRNEHDDVAKEFRRWIWVGYKASKGLLSRRIAESNLYLNAIY